MTARDRVCRGDVADGTFGAGRPVWLGRLDKVRNVVRQEMISRQLDRHLRTSPARILDVGAGQGTQSIRLARAGHLVLAVEPDPDMRAAFSAALDAERAEVRDRVRLRAGSADSLAAVASGEGYDAVLLLGVLMYLQESGPVIAELAAHVAPAGFSPSRRAPRRPRCGARPPARTGGRPWPRSTNTTAPGPWGETCATQTK